MSADFSTYQNQYPLYVDSPPLQSPTRFPSSPDSCFDKISHESLPQKRKIRDDNDEACFKSSVQNKDGNKSMKHKERKKKSREGSSSNGVGQDSSTGYIHVRARRGQATDSHSLAERVRREKISQRMKMLQGLVPGCDKVTGKALMLDEIINYVQSLQNQVEFLSMKLASMNPVLYDFAMDMDHGSMNPQEKLEEYLYQIPETSPAIQSSHIQTDTAFLQHHHPHGSISLDGVGGSDEHLQRQQQQLQLHLQGLLHQVVFNNSICPFQ